jgi:transposase
MFIRIKSTPNSPRKSVQICEGFRENGKVRQRVIRHVGVAQDEGHLSELKRLAETIKLQIIEEQKGPFLLPLQKLLPPISKNEEPQKPVLASFKPDRALPDHEQAATTALPVNLQSLRETQRTIEGFHDVFGKLFRQFGFHHLLSKKQNEVLEDVLLARIAAPASKHRTQGILAVDFGRDVPLERIYRMMDALILEKEKVQKQVLAVTEKLCFAEANILLFDVTTLYFESVETDELRGFGFSKDQKFHTTQVVLALATTKDGLPIGYRLFPGNTAEISTLLVCLEEWRKVLSIGKVIFVGDRGMMSKKNLQALEDAGIIFVVGAKLKKFAKPMQEKILQGPRQRDENKELAIQDFSLERGRRLVVSHSISRATKDKKDRERGIAKVHKRIGKGKNLKQLIPNYGYQKFLKTESEGRLLLDEGKMTEEERWDGFHGLITNATDMPVSELLGHYRRLWVIEESFRIQKYNLSLRPIYHFKPERIEAHILLCYMAFAMIRCLEFYVEKQQERVTIEEMRQELWRVQASILEDKENGKHYRVPSQTPHKAKKLYQVLGIERSLQPHEIKT